MTRSATETRVLETAYELYAAEGIDALSMRRIAGQLGITAPALYKHFESKDALVEAIADRGFELFEQRLAHDASRSPVRTVLRILHAYRQFAIDEPQLFQVMFVMPRTRRRTFPHDFAARRSASFNMLRSAVEQGMRQGKLKQDNPLEVTLNLWAYAHGLVGLYRGGRFQADTVAFQRLFDRAIRRLLSGLSPN